MGVAGGEALAAKAPTTKSSLKTLVRQTNALPAAAAPAAKRAALKRRARAALRSARKRPCASVRSLNQFRGILGKVRVKANTRKRRRAARRLSALGPASLTSSRLLLATKRTRRCGGGVKLRQRGNNPTLRIMKSNENQLRVRVALPAVQFVPREAGGQSWTQLVVHNSDAPGTPGSPGIPVVSNVLAVPDGAQIQVKTNDVDKVKMTGVDVFPAQPDPVDQDTAPPNFLAGPFADAPFQMNAKAYNRDALVPAKPADADSLGAMRDLNIGGLQIPTAQYNADSKTLVMLKSVDVTLNFVGGPHTFSDELGNPWEQFQSRLSTILLNANVFRRDLRDILRRCGEEMMVITSPSTLAAANTFAAARNAAGVRTTVFQTGAGSGFIGTTATDIQGFIRSRLNSFLCIRPSYVTIMGDDDLVPTFAGINGIPSDLQYSMKNDTDELPDLAVGRIIGNDQAAVDVAVGKIIAYENSPPSGQWLTRATIAAQFQDDDNNGQENRTFIQFAETVRNGLVSRGVAVDRVYGESPGNNPQKFNDGTDLPAALKKPTFGWNGTGAQVSTAWNEGRFMVVHRDHGWSDGWGTPGYGTADVQALTNGAFLPVVLSINCSSAAYDYDETSFVGESLVKANGGAVGAFGDTRDSPTWHNTQIALGFVDGLLPSVLPAEGPAFKQRMGNALINGKLRLAGLAPPATDGSTRNELYLWHYFGDPSMQMWGGGQPPIVLAVSQFTAIFKREIGPPPPEPPPYWVQVTLPQQFNGQAFSLLRNGDVIGKGLAQDGVANIPAAFGDSAGNAGQLEVAFEAEGSPPIKIPVTDEPPLDTTMTQQCPPRLDGFNNAPPFKVTGRLQPGFAGATVKIRYTTPEGTDPPSRSFDRTVTTDANGDWSDEIDPRTEEPDNWRGDWKVQARFEGDAEHAASIAPECTVDVFDGG